MSNNVISKMDVVADLVYSLTDWGNLDLTAYAP